MEETRTDTTKAETDIPALWESAEGLCSPATLVSTRGVLYTPHGHRLSRSDSPPEIILGWGCLDGLANVYHVPGIDNSRFLVPRDDRDADATYAEIVAEYETLSAPFSEHDNWRHTHTIHLVCGTPGHKNYSETVHEVYLDDGLFYSWRDWDTYSSPDWHLGEDGESVLFQGGTLPGVTTVTRI